MAGFAVFMNGRFWVFTEAYFEEEDNFHHYHLWGRA